jgi:hypothetical protein
VKEINGIIFTDHDIYNIKPSHIYKKHQGIGDPISDEIEYIIYKESDTVKVTRDNPAKCLAKELHAFKKRSLLSEKDAKQCLDRKKYIEIGVAADCSYVTHYGGIQSTFSQILSNVNKASKVFEETLNLQIKITGAHLESVCSKDLEKAWNRPCNESYSMSERLNDFSSWRGFLFDNLALWELFSECSTSNTLGLTWTGVICDSASLYFNGDTANSAGITTAGTDEWITFAHEV